MTSNTDTPYYDYLRSLDKDRLEGWIKYLAEVQSLSLIKKVRLAKRMLKEVPGDPTFDGHYVTTGTSKLKLYFKFRVGRLTFKLPRKTKKRVVKALRLNGMSYVDLCFMEHHHRHVVVRREMDRRIKKGYNDALEAMLVEVDREMLTTCNKARKLVEGDDTESTMLGNDSADIASHFDNDIIDVHLELNDEASDV